MRRETDAERLWQKIAERYRGKQVVALDFWGTWCVPCREEIPRHEGVGGDYAGGDVVFVFLASNSPEESWLNIIREQGLTAPNIEHFNLPDEQMRMLVDKFGVTSYPTHIVVDRQDACSRNGSGTVGRRHGPRAGYRRVAGLAGRTRNQSVPSDVEGTLCYAFVDEKNHHIMGVLPMLCR